MTTAAWQEFSTDSVVSTLRAKRWSEYGSETISDMVVEPVDEGRFCARLRRRNLGSMGYILVESTPARARSSAAAAGSWGSASADSLIMTVADQGRSTLSQSSWSADLAPGDIVIRDLCKPWQSYSTEAMGLILIRVPFSTVARFHPDPERLVGCHLSVSDPRVAFASTVLRASRRALQDAPEADWNDHLGEVLADVFRLICHDELGRDPCAEAAAGANLRRAATTYIARNLAHPDLSVCKVAQAIGVSARHLQRVFLSSGIAPRRYILEERLAEAARRLEHTSAAEESRIIDVAFGLGFNDASHFSRAFADRFGCSPREYRRTAAQSS